MYRNNKYFVFASKFQFKIETCLLAVPEKLWMFNLKVKNPMWIGVRNSEQIPKLVNREFFSGFGHVPEGCALHRKKDTQVKEGEKWLAF